jgi:hypothetical protein
MSDTPLPAARPVASPGRDARAAFAPVVAETHGCLWLENPPGSTRLDGRQWKGWASVGGTPAFRFESIDQLPVEVTWWTNLDQGEAWSLGRWRRFKDGGLLGPDWSALMTDLAPPGSASEPAVWVSRWSECFARVAERLSRWAGADGANRPWSWGETGGVEALGMRWAQWKDPAADPLAMVLEKAHVQDIRIHWPESSLRGHRQVRLSRNSWLQAQTILAHRVPKGDWTVIKDQWPHGNTSRWSWLQQQDKPLLVEIEFLGWRTDANHEADGRLLLGQRGQAFNPVPVEPVWVTGEEALDLNIHAEWNVVRGFIGDSWGPVEGLPGWWGSSPGPLTDWSMTYGLLGGMVWKAMATPIRAEESRRKGAVTPQMLWLRAADRALCRQSATILQNHGYMVVRYGEDSVDIAFDPEGSPVRLVNALRAAGLKVPRALASHVSFNSADADPDGLNLSWVIDSWIKREAPPGIHWEIDRLVAPWPGKGVQGVLQDAARQLMALGIERHLPGLQEMWKKALHQQARMSVDRLKALAGRER